MRILAFDPGLRSMGIATEVGGTAYLATSKAPAKLSRVEAYLIQAAAIEDAVAKVQPDRVVMEGPAYGAGGGARNMEQLAVVRGLIEMYAAPVEVRRIAPSSLKKFATGSGRADKVAVFTAMCDLAATRNWSIPQNTDEADALALLLMGVENG